MSDPGSAVRAMVSRFGLEGAVAGVSALGNGHINDTFRVDLARAAEGARAFVMQRLNPRVFPDQVAVMTNAAAVTGHLRARLAARGVGDLDRRVIAPVVAPDGRPWAADDEGVLWRAYLYVDGARTGSPAGGRADAFAAARAFGSFLALLADYPGPRLHETLPGFHDTPARFRRFVAAVEADPCGRARGAAAEIASCLAREAHAGALAGGALPERIVHNDAKVENVLLDERTGEALVVIDLDTVMPGLAAHDFGDLVRSAAGQAAEDDPDPTRVRLDQGVFDALAAGYLEGAGPVLVPAEREALVTGALVIVLEQSLRFLTDHLEGDSYYRVVRPGHNLDRARTQLALLAALERQEGELRRRVAALAPGA